MLENSVEPRNMERKHLTVAIMYHKRCQKKLSSVALATVRGRGASRVMQRTASEVDGKTEGGTKPPPPAKYSDDQKLRIVDDARDTGECRELQRRHSANAIGIIKQGAGCRVVDDAVIRLRRNRPGIECAGGQGAW